MVGNTMKTIEVNWRVIVSEDRPYTHRIEVPDSTPDDVIEQLIIGYQKELSLNVEEMAATVDSAIDDPCGLEIELEEWYAVNAKEAIHD